MLQKKPTDNSSSESKGISPNEPFDILKLGQEITSLESLGKVLSSNLVLTGESLKTFVESLNTMETAATTLATTFGGMRGFTASIKENMVGAAVSVMELGGELKDIASIQENVVKGLQTQTILNQDAYAELYAVGNLVSEGNKTSATTTKEMVVNFMNAGYGLYDVSKQVTGIINQSREFGVTTAAVYSQISANIGKLALYNFENGVQGMAQMAAKAASLRIDMKSTLDFAETLFNPEKAIETAAAIQRLGVNVASLLDPYKLMDMARNDPAKLQEEILKATQALTYFDEKNQKMAILPGAQQTLRELGLALNIPAGELAKMALNAGDLDRKLREIKFSPDFAGDEQSRNMIANMAQLKDGKYVVTFDEMNKQTGQIESVTKEVSQLTKDNKEALVKMNEPAKSAIELQKEANNSLVNINNSIRALKGVVPRQLAASSRITKFQKDFEKSASPYIRAAGTLVGANEDDRGFYNTNTTKKNVNAVVNTLDDVFTQVIKGKKSFSEAILTLGSLTTTAINVSDMMSGAIKAYNKQSVKVGGEEITNENINKGVDLIKDVFGLDESTIKGFRPKLDKGNTQSVIPNPGVSKSKYISNGGNNSPFDSTTTQNQNQSTAKEFKSTIDVHIKVDPTDMKAAVMNYLSQNDFTKQISQQMANLHSDNKSLRGNTPSYKVNVV